MKIADRFFVALVCSVLVFTGGCASTSPGSDSAAAHDSRDPWERANRAVLNFNFKVDRYALKPAAKVYAKLPQPVQNGIGNFFANLWEPNTIINDLLQGKLAHAGRDTGRFVINTTLGLLGLMDVATHFGLPRRNEDFGQTLAAWGVPDGPYLVLPFLGPSSVRDGAGLIPQFAYTDALGYVDSPDRYYAGATRLVDGRAGFLGADEALELQPDRYLFLREAYRQRRLQLVYDGNPPGGADADDALQDELLEDDAN